MGCATAGYMCGYWYPSIIINRMCRPTPHQLSCVVSFPVLISQVPCTSCASTTWPGWNPRRILFEGDDWTAVDFAWGPQSINIGLVCKPWTFSSLHTYCDEIGLRAWGPLQVTARLHAKVISVIWWVSKRYKWRYRFDDGRCLSLRFDPLAVWKVKQFYRNVRTPAAKMQGGPEGIWKKVALWPSPMAFWGSYPKT